MAILAGRGWRNRHLTARLYARYTAHSRFTDRGSLWVFSTLQWYICEENRQISAEMQLLKFDGVMGLCEVFVNDDHVCFHPYGYTAFVCDIGKYLHDGENTLRIEVDASCQPASRWYTGAEPYREVELLTSGRDHFTPWGVSAKILDIDSDSAQVEFSADVVSSEHQTRK